MNRYLEGDYRRLPQQNLAGASQQLRLDQLINQSQSGRRKREHDRVLLEKAIVIQACYRGYICRKFWREYFKSEFDLKLRMILHHKSGSATLDDLFYLLQRLALAYPKRRDYFGIWDRRQLQSTLKEEIHKFMTVINVMYTRREQLIEAMTVEDCWMWRVIRFLNLTMKLIKFLPNGCEKYMVKILQTTTYFTDLEKFEHFRNALDPQQVLIKVWSHLIDNDVYLCLMKALNLKVRYREFVFPEVVDLTKMCFRNLVRVINSSPDLYFKRKALKKLAEKIVRPPMSQEAGRHILPCFKHMAEFPVCDLARVIMNEHLYPKMPETLFIMLFLDNDQKSISIEDQPDYFGFITIILSYLFKMNSIECMIDEEQYMGNWDCKIGSHQYKLLQEVIPILSSPARAETWKNYLHRLIETRDHGNLLTFCSCLFFIWIPEKKPLYSIRILQYVAFHREFLNQLLVVLKATVRINYFGNQAQHLPLLTLLARGVILTSEEQDTLIPPLIMFCYFLKHSLSILNDDIFYKEDEHDGPEVVPFKLSEIREITKMLMEVTVGVISLAFSTSSHIVDKLIGRHSPDYTNFQRFVWKTLLNQLVSLLRLIHNRDSRRQFTGANFWLIDTSMFDVSRTSLHLRTMTHILPFQCNAGSAFVKVEDKYLAILLYLPFAIDFVKRIMLYQHLINELKNEYQNPALHFLQSSYVLAQIRRDYLYEDSFERLDLNEVPEMRIHVKIHLISSLGMEEAGIDGGGLFREFILELLKTAFDPNRGFFLMNKDNELYPNPKIEWIEQNFARHYFFIGRMLGKAMYENVLVEIPLAEFFLAQLVADHHDFYLMGLASLDPDMYRNLMSLMNYSGDFSDMGLDFTVSLDFFGSTHVVELKPGGSTISVTKDNVLEYIHLVAKFKTNHQIERQTQAFIAGMSSVLPQHWISMFSTKELQLLISGNESPIDISDLRENAVYNGGYSDSHPTIQMFWRVLERFNAFQKSQLLKFVTSCSRPPLLGFKELYPPFCIQFVDDENLLPSASTCMNIFKLPNFQDEQVMQEKILYAISSGSGFELI